MLSPTSVIKRHVKNRKNSVIGAKLELSVDIQEDENDAIGVSDAVMNVGEGF